MRYRTFCKVAICSVTYFISGVWRNRRIDKTVNQTGVMVIILSAVTSQSVLMLTETTIWNTHTQAPARQRMINWHSRWDKMSFTRKHTTVVISLGLNRTCNVVMKQRYPSVPLSLHLYLKTRPSSFHLLFAIQTPSSVSRHLRWRPPFGPPRWCMAPLL